MVAMAVRLLELRRKSEGQSEWKQRRLEEDKSQSMTLSRGKVLSREGKEDRGRLMID